MNPTPQLWLLVASDLAPKSADERSEAFRSVSGGPELQSGEKLLVEAYAAIWLILMGLLLLSWRRQSKLDGRIASLEKALARAEALQSSGAGEVGRAVDRPRQAPGSEPRREG